MRRESAFPLYQGRIALMKHFKLILVFVMTLCCAFAQHAQAKKDKDYEKALKQWNRHDEVYRSSDLAATILWDATWLNPEMLDAQASLFARRYNLSASEESAKRLELESKNRGYAVFFISFFTQDRKFNDLANPAHGWQMTLESGGKKYKPLYIEKIKRPVPEDLLYYPHITHWSVGYRVSFPPEAIQGGQPISLDLRNSVYHSKATW